MKTLLNTLAATALSFTLTPFAADAADRVVILSDAMPVETARNVLTQSKRVLAGMAPGETVTFIDGPSGTTVAKVSVPAGDEGAEILKSKRKIAKLFGKTVQDITDHAVASTKTFETLADDQLPLQVNLPAVLHALTLFASDKPDVVVFGSLRFDDPRMPDYSMEHSFPNDAHVFQSPSVTPFGAAGREDTLTGTRVHFCDLDQGYHKDMQQLGLERATGLLIQGHGATLATYSQMVGDCVDSALAGKVDPTKTFVADSTQTQMLNYDVTQTGQIPGTSAVEQQALFNEMSLPPQQKDELAFLMQQNQVVLAEVFLHDTDANDGDVVALVSGSVRINVALTKVPQRVIVPITNGALRMLGVRDGNGGITVGVRTSTDDTLVSPVMRVGEVVELSFLPIS
jgi:hypothetical protein